jgi:hypothetical protein
MHFPTAVIALLATTAVAVPTWGKNGKDDSVFSFDKVFVVKADPNQVRNGTTPVPGQPGAEGLFKYGINVDDNTICYVCLHPFSSYSPSHMTSLLRFNL